jgi:UDP-N-acetylmuramoylalanine-D-glutamate ligase
MIIEEVEKLLNDYTRWLKDKTILKQVGKDWVEITTPHLDRHNDCLQIYARKEGNGFVLTDDGYIITDLVNSGCPLESPKRQELLKTTLAGFGVQIDRDQLVVHATPDNFSLKKHNIIQAMLAVNDLFFLASPYVASLFVEDVTNWLELSEIRYTPNVKFTGKSGYDHMFNFVIPKSRKQPERIVQALSNPKKDAAEALVFKWLDTRETRAADSQLFAFLNDSNVSVSHSVIDALKNYELEPVLWSQREQAKERLAA